MQELSALAGIVLALTLGAISPGPSFVMLARVAMSSSRREGVRAAAGMGVGSVMFAVAALAGLQGVLLALPSLYFGLKLAGGVYLGWLGLRIWRTAGTPLVLTPVTPRQGDTFWLGLGTQLSNPKTAIVYASVFAALLPSSLTPAFTGILLLAVFMVEAGWYVLVAMLLSSTRPRQAYLRCQRGLDRGAGLVMLALGFRLLFSQKP